MSECRHHDDAKLLARVLSEDAPGIHELLVFGENTARFVEYATLRKVPSTRRAIPAAAPVPICGALSAYESAYPSPARGPAAPAPDPRAPPGPAVRRPLHPGGEGAAAVAAAVAAAAAGAAAPGAAPDVVAAAAPAAEAELVLVGTRGGAGAHEHADAADACDDDCADLCWDSPPLHGPDSARPTAGPELKVCVPAP